MMEFNPKSFNERLKKALLKNLKSGCILIRDKCVESMPIGNQQGTAPSESGETPHVGTGLLRRSIAVKIVDPDKLIGAVSTNVKYAPYLELGTSKMAARPFLRPALHNNEDELHKKLTAPME